jgi:hypothetical protein
MRCASWVAATTLVTGLGACSLTTSLDGLSNGEVIETPGGSDGGSPEATTKDGGADTATSIDAAAEGGASSYRALVLGDAPLAYYRLGDTGTVAKDEVGAHDGVYKGTVTHATGGIANDPDRAAVFDGATGFVDVGDVLPSLNNAPFTIEAWVSPVSGATDPACIAARSFAPGGVSGGLSDGYTFYLDSGTNVVNLARYRSSADDTIQGPAVTFSLFSHVVATYGSGTLSIWIDGAMVASGASTRDLSTVTNPLTIGAGRGGIYCFFRGALDEVAFYDKALAGDRIRAHHAAGTGN